jgi:hypothetical protein
LSGAYTVFARGAVARDDENLAAHFLEQRGGHTGGGFALHAKDGAKRKISNVQNSKHVFILYKVGSAVPCRPWAHAKNGSPKFDLPADTSDFSTIG